ncbi:MAG: SemiSWEET transporter [Chitinispirillaceae bacterium]|nr:SemiSWEET transporter [Chitinispirillaceae bacterium]
MTFDTARMIGLVAGILTTSSLLPQLLKTIKTRSSGDLSLVMLLMFWIGIVCWLVYGMMVNEWPIIASNSVTLVMVSILVICKIRYQ